MAHASRRAFGDARADAFAGKIPAKIAALLREAGLIALSAAVAYLALALLTYSPADPGPTNPIGAGGGAVANLGGPVGAWLADALFAGFGRSAYLFLLLLCALLWRIHRRIEAKFGDWGRALTPVGIVLALVGACGIEQIYAGGRAAPFAAGGVVGEFAAVQLEAAFGAAGAALILFALLVTGITLAAHLSWFALMDRTGYRAFAAAAWLKSRVEQRADRRAGARARQQRSQSVRTFRADIAARQPPKIAPKIDPAPEGARKQSERQKNLFAPAGGGDGVNAAVEPLPPLSLLEESTAAVAGYSRDELQAMSELLVKKLKDFNIDIRVEAVLPGPVITRFEVDPAPGVKASQIVGLARDLARSLSVESVRVVDNIAGKTVVGIEIPNQSREIVRLVDGLSSREYEKSASPLTLVLGKDIAGNPAITDLIKMPHVLIAGTTGSGKSVCINALILSIVYKSTPGQVRLIMVDPKFLELSVYDGIPHLLAPVVTDMNKAANALRWCIGEMDRRFRIMAAIGVRDIAGYNKKVAAAEAAGQPLADPLAAPPAADGDSDGGDGDGDGENDAPTLQSLPYIVVIVDELADLMMVVGKKLEEIITRIAQRARAAGIHLVLATQRPSVDVVTGLIKANVPTRIAFQVSSRADSRTIIDQMGADQLLGQGDMLFLPPGSGFTRRVHGSFVSDDEVAAVVAYLKQSGRPAYLDAITDGGDGAAGPGAAADGDARGESDPKYDEAVQFVTAKRRASISLLQRQLRVGYGRAAVIMDAMEAAGVVSPPGTNDKREVLAPPPPEV